MGFVLANGAWDGTSRLTQVYQVFAGSGQSDPVKIKFTSKVPATISPTTPFVTIVGSIQDFDGMIGCVVNFRMGLLLQ